MKPKRILGSTIAKSISDKKVPNNVSAPNKSTNAPAKYISWFMSADSIILPVVGKFKTTLTTADTEIKFGSNHPRVLITGFKANLSGYLSSSRVSLSPFDLAVTT